MDNPQIMGILNLTPDSFYDGGKNNSIKKALQKVENYIEEGVDIIDIGAYSSRPGAENISIEIEKERLLPVLKSVIKEFPNAILSVDTFRSEIAKIAVQEGAQIINDISGGEMDKKMFETISQLGVTYILMHMKGTPQTMQSQITSADIITEIKGYFQKKLSQLSEIGVEDVILDVGFGFGKSMEQNFSLLKHLSRFQMFNKRLLVGVSRKSMLYKTLQILPEEALNATSVAHTLALLNGANILRVHDVKECNETIKIIKQYQQAK
jgi:dihydropteroate synthase